MPPNLPPRPFSAPGSLPPAASSNSQTFVAILFLCPSWIGGSAWELRDGPDGLVEVLVEGASEWWVVLSRGLFFAAFLPWVPDIDLESRSGAHS